MKTINDFDLWVAKQDCLADWGGSSLSPTNSRRIEVKKGEIVEFRFVTPIHFRTIDDLFLKMEDTDFYEAFEPFGRIWETIKYNNRAKTEDILRLKLYEKWFHKHLPQEGESE